MEHAAVTSLCNRTGVHIGGALQNAHTHNAPRVASAMWLRNGRGFSLQLTKPTIIILAERSNLTFTRSGAAASSLCLSHFSDFGGGRFCRDLRKKQKNKIFRNSKNCFSKRPSPSDFRPVYSKHFLIFYETERNLQKFQRAAKAAILFPSFLVHFFACFCFAITRHVRRVL